jgi:EmrB/QacA subfamily drug resistance transporter
MAAESTSKWAVLALSGTAAFMTTLDSSIVNIGLPSIAHDFDTPLAGEVEWIVIGYLVVIAATLLSFGRLADMVGRRPVFLAGLLVFTGGSAICGAAPSLPILVVARCFQGLGGAAIFATNVAMVTAAFEPRERGRALGINMILVALGISAGPTVGGILTQAFTWRAIFYVNLPIGLVVIPLSWWLLGEQRGGRRPRFDIAGAVLLAVALGALTLGLSFGEQWGWSSPLLVGTLLSAGVALVAAIVVERRQEAPVLDLALLRNRVFVLSNLSFMLAMLALFAVGFLMPFYWEELRGLDVLSTGLLLTPYSITLGAVAPFAGSLADRTGSRWLAPMGLALACVGLLLLAGVDTGTPYIYVIGALVVAGIGQGLFSSPNSRTIMGAAPAERVGVASGILATSRVVGQSLSVAVAGAVFASFGAAAAGAALTAADAGLGPERLAQLQQTFLGGLHAALLVCAGLAAFGVVTAFARGAE